MQIFCKSRAQARHLAKGRPVIDHGKFAAKRWGAVIQVSSQSVKGE